MEINELCKHFPVDKWRCPSERASYVLQAELFLTQWGWGAVVYTSKGLKEIFLPRPSKTEIFQELPKGADVLENKSHPAVSQLVEYFSGKRSNFDLEFDLDKFTQFQKSVYEEATRIPYGRTRSYSELAKTVGLPQAARAVARALSQNPIAIVIPCHRVIQKDGGLGGYSGGLTWKGILLDLERSQMKYRFTEQNKHNCLTLPLLFFDQDTASD